MTTIEIAELLDVKQCPVCFINYAIPQELSNKRLKNGGSWFCPSGHSLVYTDTKADKLEKELKAVRETLNAARNQLASEREQHEAARASALKKEKEAKRQQKRVKNGVCPCCNRSFCNLQAHMKTQHPEYAKK